MCQEVDAKQWERLSFRNDSCYQQLNWTVAVNNRHNRFFIWYLPKKGTVAALQAGQLLKLKREKYLIYAKLIKTMQIAKTPPHFYKFIVNGPPNVSISVRKCCFFLKLKSALCSRQENELLGVKKTARLYVLIEISSGWIRSQQKCEDLLTTERFLFLVCGCVIVVERKSKKSICMLISCNPRKEKLHKKWILWKDSIPRVFNINLVLHMDFFWSYFTITFQIVKTARNFFIAHFIFLEIITLVRFNKISNLSPYFAMIFWDFNV